MLRFGDLSTRVFGFHGVADQTLNWSKLAWEDREDRVLLTGFQSIHYPLRRQIWRAASTGNASIVATLEHPGYLRGGIKNRFLGKLYFEHLSKFKGLIATTTSQRFLFGIKRIDYTVQKYVEIPASGCLCFVEESRDLARMGFLEGVNCIKITKANWLSKMQIIHSREASGIAMNGRKLVEARHLHSHRIADVVSHIRGVFGLDCKDLIGSGSALAFSVDR